MKTLIVTILNVLIYYYAFSQTSETPPFKKGGVCFPELQHYFLQDVIKKQIDPLKVEYLFYQGDISNVPAEEFPKEFLINIDKYENLKELHITGARIDSLPLAFGNLDRLECLSISNIYFGIQPKVISKLKNLKRLSINSVGVELDSLNLPNLKDKLIELSYSCRKDTLEEYISELSNLQILDVSLSGIEYIPSSICKLQNLKDLDVSYNNIKVLPECISGMMNLRELHIQRTSIKKLPDNIYNIKALKLYVSAGCDNPYKAFSEGYIIYLVNSCPDLWRIILIR